MELSRERGWREAGNEGPSRASGSHLSDHLSRAHLPGMDGAVDAAPHRLLEEEPVRSRPQAQQSRTLGLSTGRLNCAHHQAGLPLQHRAAWC